MMKHLVCWFQNLIILDKKAACAAVYGYLRSKGGWRLRQCEIECCTDDICNTQIPSKGNVKKRTILKGKVHTLVPW